MTVIAARLYRDGERVRDIDLSQPLPPLDDPADLLWIGLHEPSEAELMPTLGDKMVLFAIGILCFGVTLQAGFALMRLLQRHLGRLALRAREG